MKILTKLLLLVAVTVVCFVIAFSILGYVVISGYSDRTAQHQVSVAAKGMRAEVASRMVTQGVFSSVVAADIQLAEDTAYQRLSELKKYATALVGSDVIDFATICDMDGKVLARGQNDIIGDTVRKEQQSYAIALSQGKAVVGMEVGRDNELRMVSATPLFHYGKQVGVIMVGSNISSGALVKSIKERSDVECTIFLGDMRISTTVERDGKPVTGTNLNNPEIYDEVISRGQQVFSRNMIAGQEFDTSYWPYDTIDTKNAGMFFVGLSRATIEAEQSRLLWTFVITGLVLGAIVLVIGGLVARAIASPLRQATVFATDVAAGRFDSEIRNTSKDEVGIMVRALLEMVENLKSKISEAEQKSVEAAVQADNAAKAMSEAQVAQSRAEEGQKALLVAAGNVEEVVIRLTSSTEQLSGQVNQSSQSAERQRDQVSSSATAMEEMNATVLEVARNAAVASEASERARIKAAEGAEIVEHSVRAINKVQDDTKALQDNMEELGRQAESIGAIMTVIRDIADQTNLLALNAAIEAARAGEAGRGFAVVADEVRKLAEKTMSATHEVGNAIKGIQNGTQTNILAVQNTTGNLRSATAMVNRSGDTLAEIVNEAVYTADQVRSIAAASEEQSAASEEISRTLDDINQIAIENAGAMQESAAAVAELANQARQLQELVNNLRKP